MAITKDILKRQTTYRDFMRQWLGDEFGAIDPKLLNRVEKREAEIRAKMLPGDELWEFEIGQHFLAMTWGLAIVRNDAVVDSWTEFKS